MSSCYNRPKRRRTIVAGAAAAAVGLTLSACGTSSATPTASPKPAKSAASATSLNLKSFGTKPIHLTMWVLQSPVEVKTATAQVDAFEKLHPNVHIKVEENAGAGNVEAQLADAVSHSLPALIWTADVLTAPEAEHGILLNLSPYMKAYGYKQSEFVHNMMALGQYGGRQYAIPRGVDQVALAYNPKIFEMMHVPLPKEGITWAQFAALGPKLTKKVNGVQYYALASEGDSSFSINSYPLQEAAVRLHGGHFTNLKSTVCELDQPSAEIGINEMLQFAIRYSDINAHLPSSAWEAGHAAMAFPVKPQIAGWLNKSSTGWNLPFDPNFINFPLTSPHIEIPAGMSGYAVTTDVSGDARNAAAAYAMFLLSRQGELIRSRVAGSVPIRLDLANSTVWRSYPPVKPPINQEAFVAYDQHEALPTAIPISQGAAYTAIDNAYQSVLLGKASVDRAMKTACVAIDKALRDGQLVPVPRS